MDIKGEKTEMNLATQTQGAAAAAPSDLPPPPAAPVNAQRWRDYVVYFGFAAVFLFFAVTVGSDFYALGNLENIVRVAAPISVMAVGTAFVLSAGEIDLSLAGVVALAALVTAVVLEKQGLLLAIPAGLGVGVVTGLVNGIVTVRFRIPSFLVTLGTLSVLGGLARMITDLQSVPVLDKSYTNIFGSGSLGPISSLVVWTIVALIVGHIIYRHTPFGVRILATGGNRDAAESAGINTARVKVAALVISATSAALAGMLYAGWLQGARYSLGETDLLTVIAAVVIGGTSLFGGKGSIVGAVVGSLLMGMLANGLILLGLDVAGQMVARGIIIVLAVVISLREIRK